MHCGPQLTLACLVASVTCLRAQEETVRYDGETVASTVARSPRPRTRIVALADERQAQWRQASQHIAEGERVLIGRRLDCSVAPPPSTNREFLDSYASALRHFGMAANVAPFCAEALLAHAASTPQTHARLCMLEAVGDNWSDALAHRPPAESLLIALSQAPNSALVRNNAAEMLWRIASTTGSRAAADRFVDHVSGRWPENREVLAGVPDVALLELPRHVRAHDIRVSVRMAASLGGARVVERLLERQATHPSRAHVDFVLGCLVLAAPQVDEATARRLHGLFVLDPNNLGAVKEDLTERQRQVLRLIAGIYPRLPEDLLPSVEPLFENEIAGAFLREHVRSRLR